MIAVTQELASSFDVHQEPQNPTALVAVDIMLEDAKRYHELLPEMSNDKTMI